MLGRILPGFFPSSRGELAPPGATRSGPVDGGVGAFCSACHSRDRALRAQSCELIREASRLGVPREAVPAIRKVELSFRGRLMRTMHYKDELTLQ